MILLGIATELGEARAMTIRTTLVMAVMLWASCCPTWAQAVPDLIPTDQIETLRQEQDPFFLDVRTPAEVHSQGTLPGYYNIPIDELESRLDELPRDRLILTA